MNQSIPRYWSPLSPGHLQWTNLFLDIGLPCHPAIYSTGFVFLVTRQSTVNQSIPRYLSPLSPDNLFHGICLPCHPAIYSAPIYSTGIVSLAIWSFTVVKYISEADWMTLVDLHWLVTHAPLSFSVWPGSELRRLRCPGFCVCGVMGLFCTP